MLGQGKNLARLLEGQHERKGWKGDCAVLFTSRVTFEKSTFFLFALYHWQKKIYRPSRRDSRWIFFSV